MGKGKKLNFNYKYTDSAVLNTLAYYDYLERFKKLVLSIFE